MIIIRRVYKWCNFSINSCIDLPFFYIIFHSNSFIHSKAILEEHLEILLEVLEMLIQIWAIDSSLKRTAHSDNRMLKVSGSEFQGRRHSTHWQCCLQASQSISIRIRHLPISIWKLKLLELSNGLKSVRSLNEEHKVHFSLHFSSALDQFSIQELGSFGFVWSHCDQFAYSMKQKIIVLLQTMVFAFLIP